MQLARPVQATTSEQLCHTRRPVRARKVSGRFGFTIFDRRSGRLLLEMVVMSGKQYEEPRHPVHLHRLKPLLLFVRACLPLACTNTTLGPIEGMAADGYDDIVS